MFSSLPSSSLRRTQIGSFRWCLRERKKSNRKLLALKKSLFSSFFLWKSFFLCGFSMREFFPYSMMRETFFFFAFISSSTPLFFLVIDGVWVSAFEFFLRVALFYWRSRARFEECPTVKWSKWKVSLMFAMIRYLKMMHKLFPRDLKLWSILSNYLKLQDLF